MIPPVVARGIGPRGVRVALVVLALAYFTALMKRLPDGRLTRPISFFTRATCLFPNAASYKIGYRLATWSCEERTWRPADARAFFPIRAEDKESRFHRLAHFYKYNRTVMQALDAFVSERQAERAPIGGVRLVQTLAPIPAPGSAVERFLFEPLAPIPRDGIRDLYYTPASQRKARCEVPR